MDTAASWEQLLQHADRFQMGARKVPEGNLANAWPGKPCRAAAAVATVPERAAGCCGATCNPIALPVSIHILLIRLLEIGRVARCFALGCGPHDLPCFVEDHFDGSKLGQAFIRDPI
mmetsp:Transcript_57569/g.135483  ORF Transcript_57569/g.135483 Transcript_57569/m.135483 type:complete len:117 (-) Transcript_57569:356-706(-)